MTTSETSMTPDELRDWRDTQLLSQQGLADQLGVDHMTISRWERGERAIPSFLHLALQALSARTRVDTTFTPF